MDERQLSELRANVELAVHDLIGQFQSRGMSPESSFEQAELRLYEFVRSPFGTEHSTLPPADADGFLPALIPCPIGTIRDRFGMQSERRQALMARLEGVVRVANELNQCRIMLGGSFLTTAAAPNDLDLAILVDSEDVMHPDVLLWISEIDPELQVFVERVESEWWDWFRHFGRPKPPHKRYIGVVEVMYDSD